MILGNLIKYSTIGGGTLISLALLSQPVQALSTTFSFNASDNNLSTITKTVNGVTLTVSGFSPTALSRTDADGLCFSGTGTNGAFCNINFLNLSFSDPVQLISYQVGFLTPSNGTSTLTFTQGANTSVETSFVDEATQNFSNQFVVTGNQSIGVAATNLVGRGSNQIRNLTVDTAVPVPFELDTRQMFITGALFGGAVWARRKLKSHQKLSSK